MPLIIICGFPASGKSSRAEEIRKYLDKGNKPSRLVIETEVISKAGFDVNSCYTDSQKEKLVRSELKSEVIRFLDKDETVILDGINYIKGFRYELFCATKAARTSHCVLYCAIQKERAWKFNQQRLQTQSSNLNYEQHVFEGLCMRFEEPNSNCRWDSPLFTIYPEDSLNVDSIDSALYNSKPLISNQSTQIQPLSTANYLFEFDRITQEIIAELLAARKVGVLTPQFVKGSDIKLNIPSNINSSQLNRLRRQFINYSKMHHVTSSALDKVPQLFVQFLNTYCNQ